MGENIKKSEDVIVMDNGCLCCSIRGDLQTTLEDLLPRREQFEAVMLETTGVADPAPIIFTLNSIPAIKANYRIDAVVTLVDAKHVREHLDEEKPDGAVNEAQQQIAFADRVLLNKPDLVSAKALVAVKRRIRSVNRFAELIVTQQSRVDVRRILGQNAFDIEKSCDIDPRLLEDELPEEPHGHSHSHGHGEECHDEHCTADHDHGEHAHGGHEHGEHAHGHEHGEDCHDEHCTADHDHGEHAHGHEHEEHAHGGHEHEEHAHGGHEHEEHEHGEHAHGGHEHEEHEHEEHEHEEHEHEESTKGGAAAKRHDLSLVGSVGLKFSGTMDTQAFNMVMATLLRKRAKDIFRSKGVLAFDGEGDTKYLFQGVHDQIDFGPASTPWAEGEERLNKLVFIGRGLDRAELKALIGRSVAPVSEETLAEIEADFYDTMNMNMPDAYADEDEAAGEGEDEEELAAVRAAYELAQKNNMA